jgi:ferritin-like metal-binding protein YciE
MKIESLHALLLHELADLYDAEHQILDALKKMAEAATSPELKAAFEEHRGQTEGQVTRLEEAFGLLDEKAKRQHCPGMKGLLEEGEEMIKAEMPDVVRDCALIGSAQRVEHYEMAAYGTARALAEEMGHDEVAELLQATLDEEGETDQLLSELAESTINPTAMESASGMEE